MYPIHLTIRIQTTSEGGLTEFASNLNQLNANYVWIQINSNQLAFNAHYFHHVDRPLAFKILANF